MADVPSGASLDSTPTMQIKKKIKICGYESIHVVWDKVEGVNRNKEKKGNLSNKLVF
jgi:hypothetical protein